MINTNDDFGFFDLKRQCYFIPIELQERYKPYENQFHFEVYYYTDEDVRDGVILKDKVIERYRQGGKDHD